MSKDTKTFRINNRFGASKLLKDYAHMVRQVEYHRGIAPDCKVLVVPGTYDLLHIGHARYIAGCREFADIVIVLVDTDAAVKIAKGSDRPIIPEDERYEMVQHLEHTDYVCPLESYDQKTGLWDITLPFKPDVIVLSQREPADDQPFLNKVKKLCDRLEILESQAETSTSSNVRKMTLGVVDNIEEIFKDTLERVRESLGQKPAKQETKE